VSQEINHEDLMRFIDGELPPDEAARIEEVIARSTELGRELAIFKAMKGGFTDLTFHPGEYHHSVWDQVNQRLTRPIGWLLAVGGAAVWIAYGVYVFATGPTDPVEKMATGAIVIGVLLLLTSVIWEQYRQWLVDPYRDVHR